ncbi:MAG: recombinase family protein, partial [Oscillospiraceae bacterium]|nr:recombinase family protein [Oscillospiraceae bacterium]
MARKSRKPNNQINIDSLKDSEHIAGAYVRISKKSVDSIESQEAIIMDYLSNKKDIILHKVYVDDEVSSFSSLRPGYEALLKDLEDKTINCIIVKDLSRLGRSYLETGELAWRVLPSLNARLISISDQFDSTLDMRVSNFIMSLKNVLNYSYSKDISQKVKSSIGLKQRNGTYIAASIPYGYRKEIQDFEMKYVVDSKTANIVESIFSLAAEGRSAFEIAGMLNEQAIVSLKGFETETPLNDRVWTRRTIMDVLRNPFYVGTLVTGKTKTPSDNMRHPKRLPTNQWVLFENHHASIISQELFDKVQGILNIRRAAYLSTGAGIQQNNDNYLGAILYCGFCGRKMKKRVWQRKTYFICSSYGEAKGNCVINSIAAENLKHDILDATKLLIEEAKSYREKQTQFENTDLFINYRMSLKTLLNSMENKYTYLLKIRAAFYQDICKGTYTPSDYKVYTKYFDT